MNGSIHTDVDLGSQDYDSDDEELSFMSIEHFDKLPWEVALTLETVRRIETFPTALKKTVLQKLLWLAEGHRSK